MERKDFVEKEIEKISTILRHILAKILKEKQSCSGEEMYIIIHNKLKLDLQFDIQQFIEHQEEDIIDSLVEQRKWNIDQLQVFGDILFELYLKYAQDEQKRNTILFHWKTITEYIAEQTGTYTLDLHKKKYLK